MGTLQEMRSFWCALQLQNPQKVECVILVRDLWRCDAVECHAMHVIFIRPIVLASYQAGNHTKNPSYDEDDPAVYTLAKHDAIVTKQMRQCEYYIILLIYGFGAAGTERRNR